MTVHLVYPCSQRIQAPDTIGRHLATGLRDRGYQVRVYPWDQVGWLPGGPNDVLLGHPHPAPGTILRQSLRRGRWKRRIAMSPFNGDTGQLAFVDPVLRWVDLYAAICGPPWFATAEHSHFAHWCPKMRRLDMAADRDEFPRVKESFGPRGQRRLLFIGNPTHAKGASYLTSLARLRPNYEFGWMGVGQQLRGFTAHGWQDFAQPESQRVIATYDIVLAPGRADANPTTVLEAIAWGLIPAATATSGYTMADGVIELPSSADAGALVLDELQDMSDVQLQSIRARNDELLDTRYTWARFCDTVAELIESTDSPPLGPVSRARRTRLLAARATGPLSPLHADGRRLFGNAYRGQWRHPWSIWNAVA